jgi:hypothetical protein
MSGQHRGFTYYVTTVHGGLAWDVEVYPTPEDRAEIPAELFMFTLNAFGEPHRAVKAWIDGMIAERAAFEGASA